MASDNGLNSEMTVIGCGTTIRGEVDFDQGARILGIFEGKIRSKGEVHIAESANCNAEIDALNIVIDGKTDGNIIARDRCRLSSHANLTGDITAKTLLVEEGATFVGHCRVGSDVQMDQASTSGSSSSASTAPKAGSRVDFKPPWKTTEAATTEASSSTESEKSTANAGAA